MGAEVGGVAGAVIEGYYFDKKVDKLSEAVEKVMTSAHLKAKALMSDGFSGLTVQQIELFKHIDLSLDGIKNVYESEMHLTVDKIDKKAQAWLKSLPLPGNIRELKNLIERTVLLTEHDTIEIKDFEQHLEQRPVSSQAGLIPAGLSIDEMELTMIKQAMEFHQKNISKVAKALGLSRGTLYRKLEKYNIPYETQN